MASLKDLGMFGAKVLFGADSVDRGIQNKQSQDYGRTRNQLADLGLQFQQEQYGNKNRLAELAMQGKEREAAKGAMDTNLANARVFVGALGPDFEQLPPDQQGQRWQMARQQLIGIDPSNEDMPEVFDPNGYNMIKGMAALAGHAGNNGVQSTFTTKDGRLGYVTRDGRTVVTDQDVQRSYQVINRGDDAYLLDNKAGTVSPVGGGTNDQLRDSAERQRQAEVEKTRQEALAKEEAKSQVAQGEQARASAQVLGKLDQMEQLVQKGVYGGGILDRAGRLAAGAGVPFDDQKAARTQQLRQLATELKLQAKPPGMGSMSDSEWQILKEAIPNPDAGTPEQIQAGIEQFRKTVQARMQSPSQGATQRLRYNPQTGELEPAQ
ncbi:MAG: hypothetical protein ACPH3N_00725 [Alcanivorax sediminis]|uniref:hypothetical protein n=1 Tax=Alcanivorax sediminis TaxID=2663008 RepID=UPI003C666C5C